MYHQKQIGLQVPFDFIVVRVYQPHHLQRMQLGRSELSHLVSFFYCHTQLGLFRVFFYCHTCLVFFIFFYCHTWLVIFIVFFIVKHCYFLQLFFYCHTWLVFFIVFLLSHLVISYCHTWLFFIVTHGYSILQYFLLSHLDSFFLQFFIVTPDFCLSPKDTFVQQKHSYEIKPAQLGPTADWTVGPPLLLAPTPKEERVVPVLEIFNK